MTAASPTGRPRLVAALTLGALLGLAVPASATPTAVPFVAGDEAAVRFGGGLDQFSGGVPVPVRWATVGGRVTLRWRASERITDDSGLQVRIGGTIVGSARVGPGAGAASFEVPRTALRGASRTLPVLVQTRLRTTDPCPAPDDPDAWMQLDRGSGLTVDGAPPAGPPRLKELPGALVTAVGRERGRVLVRFTRAPSPAAIRAAGLALGEVAAVAAGDGVAVRVSRPGSPTRRRVGESVITVAEGAAVPTVHTEVVGTDRASVVVVSGRGEGLLRAAGALRPSVARRLRGTVAAGSALPAVTVRRGTLPRRIRLPVGRVTGLGANQITLGFRIPEWREVLRGSRLRLAAGYDAPAGGRAIVSVNGRTLVGEPLRSSGTARFAVEEALAPRGPALFRADLRAGLNTVAVSTRLDRPRRLSCAPEAFDIGGVQVEDAGSVTLQTRARRVSSTLSVLPFPLDRRPGWAGTTVALPAAPTEPELAAVLGTLAEARRVSDELVLPRIQLGGGVPDGTALVLARPGAVPAALVRDVPGPRTSGVLTSSKDGSAVRILAIGPKALLPLANGYAIGKVQGRVVEALSATRVAIRVPDAELVTGVQRGPVPWRWPLIIIGVATLVLAALALNRTTRSLRRRTAGAARPTDRDDGDPRP